MPMMDVAIGIVWRDGLLAICRRQDDAHLGGFWEFPGGKVEAGETPAECVCREIKEELGLTVRPTHPFAPIEFTYADRAIRLHPFLCEAVAGQAAPLAAADLRWVVPAELPQYRFPPANATLIEQLLRMFPG